MDCRLFLLAVFVISLAYVAAQEQPEITKAILPEIKRKGLTAYLNCTVTRQGTSKVFWSHKQRRLEITQDDQVTVGERFNQVVNGLPKYEIFRLPDGDGWTYQLVVHRLSQIDIGTYICKIQVTGTGETKEKFGKLLVLVPPDIQNGKTTHTLSVPKGGSAKLTCAAEGYPMPNITWFRPNGKAIPGRGYSYNGETLYLEDVTLDNRGMYRCVANNNVRPPATFDATLFIEFAPEATPVQSTYGQATNRQFDLTIECIISGYPPPTLHWYKITEGGGRKAITDDDWHSINTLLSHGNFLSISERWYQLTIRNVRARDLGDYVCEETDLCQGANCPKNVNDINSAKRNVIATSIVFISVTLSCLLYQW
ncbi:hypothetical protein LSH36_703g01056 [Paralvinella palmiformis]|uniref:Ig-like domain-containing protein n=1 Tax=Paralvinella palmiformis TaxID=53620 RepID=A0AAD9J3S9_9ANNE|nr:hypothetical protein LSH36_703g01056 [Paralvinella palmiformis]